MVRGCDVIHLLMLIIDTMHSYVYQTNIVINRVVSVYLLFSIIMYVYIYILNFFVDTCRIRKYEVIFSFDTHSDLYTMQKPSYLV